MNAQLIMEQFIEMLRYKLVSFTDILWKCLDFFNKNPGLAPLIASLSVLFAVRNAYSASTREKRHKKEYSTILRNKIFIEIRDLEKSYLGKLNIINNFLGKIRNMNDQNAKILYQHEIKARIMIKYNSIEQKEREAISINKELDQFYKKIELMTKYDIEKEYLDSPFVIPLHDIKAFESIISIYEKAEYFTKKERIAFLNVIKNYREGVYYKDIPDKFSMKTFFLQTIYNSIASLKTLLEEKVNSIK